VTLFRFINHVTVLIGYIGALHLAARCRVNGGARRASATVAFLAWLIGVFFSPVFH
jgi:hypothetical protein